jgi:hypothetical protein
MDPMILLVIGLFLVVFPLFWCGILWLLSILSGWHMLAARFPAPDEERGERYSGASARIGAGIPVNFNYTLTVHIDQAGVRLACSLPALGAFKPMHIPWRAIVEATPKRVLFGNAVRLGIQGWNGMIELRGKVGEAVMAARGRAG